MAGSIPPARPDAHATRSSTCSSMPRDETLEALLDGGATALRTSLSGTPQRLRDCSDSLRDLLRDLAARPQLRERDALLEKLQGWVLEARRQGEAAARPSPLQAVQGLSLQAFGSSVMGTSNRGGDLDISLEGEVPDENVSPSGFLADANRCFKGELLGEVHGVLRQGNRFRSSKHTQLIRQAKVPVSKFVEMNTGIHCDLSIGNSTGVFKSQLLAEVLKMDARVKELVVIVKKWARANNMNDPTSGSFNSYCLTLLVITFAQTRKPPLLPPFKTLFPGLRSTLMESGKAGSKSLLSQIGKYQKLAADWVESNKDSLEKNTDSLCELLMGFLVSLSLYASHSQLMHYTAEGVSKSTIRPTASPWEGGFISTGWEAKALKKYQLFVEDPFEAKDNCARTLATQDWWRICKTLQETVVALQDFINASSCDAWNKWHDLWIMLFQRPPPYQIRTPDYWDRSKETKTSSGIQSELMVLHRDALVEHLRRFKMSDKRFIAVSDSWWSREFKNYVMLAVGEMGLFRGDGPKKKLLISKDSDIKEALVEHAVNSTLRSRKNQSTIIDPYECVVKQRLREFLKCSLRYHIFYSAAFRREIKDWIMKCVENAGLRGEFIDSGDLRVERTSDFLTNRVPCGWVGNETGISLSPGHIGHCFPVDHLEARLDIVNSRECETPEEVKLDPERPVAEKENGAVLHNENDAPSCSDEAHEDALSDVDERTPSVNGASSCSESTLLPGSSLEAGGTILKCVESIRQACSAEEVSGGSQQESCGEGATMTCVKASVGFEQPTTQLVREDSGNHVEVIMDSIQNFVSVHLKVMGGCGADGRVLGGPQGLERGILAEKKMDMLPSSDLLHKELQTPQKVRRQQDVSLTSPAGSPSKMNPEQHQRNSEILRQVFFDLFQRLEDLKQSEYAIGEVQIDPTEFVVPVAWVRQQVRDIARNLFLEVVPANGKKRRAMKIRVRKRRFDESESDSMDYNKDSYQLSPQKRQARGNERFNMIHRGSDRIIRNVPQNPWPLLDEDQKDHVTNCLQWVKKQKRPFEFWTEIYPPNVQHALQDRAEELGLSVEIAMDKMYLGLDHSHRRPNCSRLNLISSQALNQQVQHSIQRYLQQRMNQFLMDGADSVQLPCKGFFMRPRWVMEEGIRIAQSLGLDAVDLNDKLEIINGTKLAERERLLQLLRQQRCQSNVGQQENYQPTSQVSVSNGGCTPHSMVQHTERVNPQTTPAADPASRSSPAQNAVPMPHSTRFPTQSKQSNSHRCDPGAGHSRGSGRGNKGSPAPDNFMRQLRGERGLQKGDNGPNQISRSERPSQASTSRKYGRGRGSRARVENKKDPISSTVPCEEERSAPQRGRRGRNSGGGLKRLKNT